MSYRGKEPKKSCVVKDFCAPFKLSNEVLCDLMKRLHNAIKTGLSKQTHETATVKCFPTYIQDLPQGDEEGQFLAIDLGGAAFRILRITLHPNQKPKVESRVYAIPEEKTHGKSEEFFDYLAETVETFKESLNLGDQEYGLGFCFAFPHKLNNLDSGILVNWTKQFDVEGVVGQDVCALLQAALDKKNLNVKVKAIVNDTAGCLMSCAHNDSNCRVAVIIGNGTNACYMEKIENVELVDDKSKPHMIVNTEWGNFGADGTLNDIATDVDRELDQQSLRPGQQTFEKMVSALYICELIRICMMKCAEKKYLFQGEIPERLQKKGALIPEYIYEIEKDEGDMLKTSQVLENLGLQTTSIVDCVNVRYIVRTLCRRSADLLSMAVATLINRISMTPVTVGIDGGMYRNHPTYKTMLMEKIRCMVNPKIQFNLLLSDDGSGKGAAVVVASIMKKKA